MCVFVFHYHVVYDSIFFLPQLDVCPRLASDLAGEFCQDAAVSKFRAVSSAAPQTNDIVAEGLDAEVSALLMTGCGKRSRHL